MGSIILLVLPSGLGQLEAHFEFQYCRSVYNWLQRIQLSFHSLLTKLQNISCKAHCQIHVFPWRAYRWPSHFTCASRSWTVTLFFFFLYKKRDLLILLCSRSCKAMGGGGRTCVMGGQTCQVESVDRAFFGFVFDFLVLFVCLGFFFHFW